MEPEAFETAYPEPTRLGQPPLQLHNHSSREGIPTTLYTSNIYPPPHYVGEDRHLYSTATKIPGVRDVSVNGISKEVVVALPTGDVKVPFAAASRYFKTGYRVFDLDGRILRTIKDSYGRRSLKHGTDPLAEAYRREVARARANSHLFARDGRRLAEPEKRRTDYELGMFSRNSL